MGADEELTFEVRASEAHVFEQGGLAMHPSSGTVGKIAKVYAAGEYPDGSEPECGVLQIERCTEPVLRFESGDCFRASACAGANSRDLELYLTAVETVATISKVLAQLACSARVSQHNAKLIIAGVLSRQAMVFHSGG